MSRRWNCGFVAGAWVVAAVCAGAGQRANPHAAMLDEFTRRVREYLDLEKRAGQALPKLKPTPSAAEIAGHEHELAAVIQRARASARQGEIFTAPIAAEFRRLIAITMRGPAAARIRQSLENGEPVQVHLHVNDVYPPGVPVQSMPPSLLENLPELPAGLSYGVVGRDLVLRDLKANLLVDFLPAALPERSLRR